MTDAPQTIDLTPTWAEAMTILCAALENGTGEGRDAARRELARVAGMLDELADNLGVPLQAFDVIAGRETEGDFNATFTTDAAAHDYAERMRAHGFAVGAVAKIELHTTAESGMADAARFFDAPALIEAGR